MGSKIVASLRPIAGTRPRGIDNQQDLEFEKDLLKDPKEIAEHVMLIDLGRNDLGRVCEIGTVEVKDLMVIEKYSRGPYAGVYGSIDINGALNTAITIRTMIVKPSRDGKYDVSVQAGAGIVADSSPENEYQETINKAKGILKALSCLDK